MPPDDLPLSPVVQQRTSRGNTSVLDQFPILRSMTGRRRRDTPSTQLLRAQYLILQLEKNGHPEWKDEHGQELTSVSQAELSRRTGVNPSYLSAIKHPEIRRNTDVGGATLAKLALGVGIDIRYFYEPYDGERSYMTYLLSRYREGRQFDAAIKSEMDKLRQELRAEMDAMRARNLVVLPPGNAVAPGDAESMKAEISQLKAENARLKRRLRSA